MTVCGRVEPGTHFDPDRIADEYWKLHTEPVDGMDDRGHLPLTALAGPAGRES